MVLLKAFFLKKLVLKKISADGQIACKITQHGIVANEFKLQKEIGLGLCCVCIWSPKMISHFDSSKYIK